MRVATIGSGPAGLLVGAALARRGHEVLTVDRDPGPTADGAWERRGVMQFEHAHGFRPQVPMTMLAEWPAAHDAWLGLGAEPATITLSGGGEAPMGMRSRRSTFERALRTTAMQTPRLRLHTGHVDGLVEHGGRVAGIVVDGRPVEADLVVDASGRSGRLTDAEDEVTGDCGMSYVDRVYRLLPGAEPGPLLNQVVWAGNFDGYQTLLFLHEAGYFSLLFVRPTADAAMKDLRHEPVFEAACRAVPALAEWTAPGRSAPATPVLVGGALRNVYRPQAHRPGLVAVGDSVATTTPTAGRGIAMTCMQVGALLSLLDAGADPTTVADPFGAWCDATMRPWVEDHVVQDTEAVARWKGADVDLSRPLSSTRILDAAQVESRINDYAPGYLSMMALPDVLAPAEPLARAVYESGWRPDYSEGPSRDELVALISRVAA